ncbi:cilia- and flagella-associated protein 100-like [Fundulus heteroclitus]|uniref:cilia- and flagella-associated protein 100-like n=1 Tax=Fundulus heteroclitus TaxID=8078 RepID=UPI00165AC10C|nr:cilia- and flagella-associated protein 100-like [Fundulus heteroclitus]
MEKKLGGLRKNPTPLSPDFAFRSMLPASLKGQSDPFNYNEREAELEAEVAMLRKKTEALDRVITPLETNVKCHQHFYDREIYNIRKFITKVEKKPLDAKIMFENAVKSKQDCSVALEKLLKETVILKSEFEKAEDVLNRHKSYKTVLLNLAPPEWREAKEAERLKAKDALKEHNCEPEETTDKKGEEAALKSGPKGTLPLESKLSVPEGENQLTNSSVLSGVGEEEKTAEIYFTDPFDVVVLQSELTDQVLFLIENATERDRMLEQSLETTLAIVKEDEKKLTKQENNLKSRTEMEIKRGVVLRKQVQLHNSLKTQDQDIMLEALSRKVTEVHSCCVESRPLNLATLEKLCSIEYRMVGLLQQIENIPEDMFQTLWKIKDSERKARLHEQKLLEEREKQKEKMNNCMRRVYREAKRYTGRKLMQRCIPVQKKAEVVAEPSAPVEEDPHAELLTEGWE